MFWRLIISVFLVAQSFYLNSQNLEQTHNLARNSFESGDYKGAKDLYNRVLFFDSLDLYVDSYQDLAEIALYNKDYAEAKKLFGLHSNWVDSDSIRVYNTFKSVLCSFMLEDYKQALVSLLLIKNKIVEPSLKKKWELHLAVAYFQDGQYEKSKEIFSSLVSVGSEKNELDKIFRKNSRLEKKFNRIKVQLMSIFLPGLGQAYTGNLGPGINSFVLVGSFLYLFTRAVKLLSVPDAILAVYPWLSRYYIGGVKKSGDFADERIKILRAKNYQKILSLVKEAS